MATKKTPEFQTETKKRGRPRKTETKPKSKPNPVDVIRPPKKLNGGVTAAATIEVPDGDNTKYTTFALCIAGLPTIDLHKPEQVKKRILDYFQLCADHDMKPQVVALSLALGIDRQRLWEIKTDNERQLPIPVESKKHIKQAYVILEMLNNDYMQNGKINPVSAIFLAKNHFGYRDQQEYVLTPNNPLGSDVDTATIAAKYDELPD